jgi:hypothetical protein
VLQRQMQAADAVALPQDATATAGSWRLPAGFLPAELPTSADTQGLEAALARQADNLGSLDTLPSDLPLPQLLQQLRQQLQHLFMVDAKEGVTDTEVQHSLRTTERVLLQLAAAGFEQPALTASEVDLLAEIVDSYRVVITAFKDNLDSGHLAMLQAELCSREVLVGWVAYCLTHQAARPAHSLVSQFGVALDWWDLRHLVLTDKAAADAALGVASYLQQHSKAGKELFHLSQQEHSLRFADQYAAADSSMCDMLSAHKTAAEARMDAHYEAVQRKHEEARQLRRQLADQERELSSLNSRLGSSSLFSWTPEYRYLKSQASSLESSIRATRSDLAAAERPPASVIQPLPRQQTLARQWLFFLHMPQLLRCLARASCLAQQLLLPQSMSDKLRQQLQVPGLRTALPEHYDKYQGVNTYHVQWPQYSGTDRGPGNVLSMSTGTVPDKVGPEHIDSYYSREDGVWFPDSLHPTMAWQGSDCSADVMKGTAFNPFAVTDTKAIVESFTAQLPNSYSSVQWAVYQYGSTAATASNRGNRGLASQGEKPDDLSNRAYVALTALRSFPTRQLNRLCEYLRDKELPLEHPAVQLTVQQAVYHLGELTASSGSSSTGSSSGRYSVGQF